MDKYKSFSFSISNKKLFSEVEESINWQFEFLSMEEFFDKVDHLELTNFSKVKNFGKVKKSLKLSMLFCPV